MKKDGKREQKGATTSIVTGIRGDMFSKCQLLSVVEG